MGTSNLLNTSTPNLKALLSNGRVYRVPPFQRDYSWRRENWEDLWLDLLELTKGATRQHYMGAVVLRQEGAEEFQVIDGQQRLATLSLVVLAVVKRLLVLADDGIEPDQNRERATLLRSAFIGTKQAGSLIEASKLTLNRNDKGFYEGTLVQLRDPVSVRTLSASERFLWGAFCYFRDRVTEEFSEYSGQQLAEWIESLVSVRLLFIQVTVEDEVGAYTVFETLNARGLDLTAGDLIKNYLMSKVEQSGEGDLAFVLDKWSRISAHVRAGRLPEFLRHYYNSRYPFVRKDRLFRGIRNRVATADQAIALVEDLERAAVRYGALSAGDNEFWLDFDGAARHVRALVLFGVGQYRPLALAALDKMDGNEVVTVLRDCVTLSMRFNMVARRGTHELEKRYNLAAIAVTEGRAETAAEIRKFLLPAYVDDEEFRSDFERYQLPRSPKGKKLVRYVLCELEHQNSGQDLSWGSLRATIEHIVPESLTAEWEECFPSTRHAELVDRLGNFALLESGLNNQIGQEPFSEKVLAFRKSQYQLTQELGQLSEWTPAALTERQKGLAKMATAIWRFPS